MVETEGRVEALDPRVPAPSCSGRQFGSNGNQRVWWRPSDVLRGARPAEFSSVAQHMPMWLQWEAARVVEAEARVEGLKPVVSALSCSGHRFGSNGEQPGWWRLREVLRSSICWFQLRCATHADVALMGSSRVGARLREVLTGSTRGFQLCRAADGDLVLMGSSPCGGG